MSLIERILIAVAVGVLLFLYIQQNRQFWHTMQDEDAKISELNSRMNLLDARMMHQQDSAVEEEEETESPSAQPEEDVKAAKAVEDSVPDAFDSLGLAPVDV